MSTLFVANRGEIARRIFRTARSMGLHVVAAHVDADVDAPFVHEADEVVRLPTSYLDIGAVIDAAVTTGADAVHPGYGFLAENPAFAAGVIEAGLTWVGPPPGVIEAMGDKVAAKRAATDAGVPTLPSTEDPAAGDEIGYPLLVKAVAGGGGKGMRVVAAPDELADAVASARREAESGFGDGRIFLERFVRRARHVEIQILGDTHGNLVQLGERECSIQRRHQKIIEESPSPALDEALRATMGSAALTLAEALGYQSAGTVEFLLDDDTREFWFLEMNTRLQVEHPVTEEVTGLDLVREQLRVAAGEPLGYGQADVAMSGHAVEARLYAEDPARGFLPATGTLAELEPAPEPPVRWDSGVERGSKVGVDFDPMLAKVVAHAPTRSEAVGRLALALERLHIGGLTTNRDFLVGVLRSAELLAGDTTTDFIERVAPGRARDVPEEELQRIAVAAALWVQRANRRDARTLRNVPGGWRNARLPPERVEVAIEDRVVVVHYRHRRDGTFAVGPDGEEATAEIHRWTTGLIDLELSGRRTTYRVGRTGAHLHVTGRHGTTTARLVPRFAASVADAPSGSLEAPMPGLALEVRVAVGDTVAAGQTLVVIEAMKMEHHIRAGFAGVVTAVHVDKGDQLENAAPLLVIEPADRGDAEMADGRGDAP